MSVLGFEVPADVSEAVYDALEKIRRDGKIKKGINEVTKAVERGLAKLVVVADDVSPKEILMHLPLLCKEKNIPIISVPSKQELGGSVGMQISTSSVAVIDYGKNKSVFEDVVNKIKSLKE